MTSPSPLVIVPGIAVASTFYYARYGRLYARGMASYVRYNQSRVGGESSWHAIKSEAYELWEAMLSGDVWEMALEASDLLHSVIKYAVVEFLPMQFTTSIVPWVIMSFIVPLVAIKLAKRYDQYGCVRNHRNPANCDHMCDYMGVD